jgi:DNA-binding IclR family transcriptional regulator
MWFRRTAREGRAVLAALSAVGDTGMTALALAVTLNQPETRLHAVLDRLLQAGLIHRCVDSAGVTHLRRSRYRLCRTAAVSPATRTIRAGVPAIPAPRRG